MKEATTKIDLAEIEKITNSLNNGIDLADLLSDYKVGISRYEASKIATALEAVPKLVEALQSAHLLLKQSHPTFEDWVENDFYLKVLSSFTTKTEQP